MIFAFYNLAAQLAGALGGLVVALPETLSHVGVATEISMRSLFVLYGLLAGSTALLFLRLSPAAEVQPAQEKTKTAAVPSANAAATDEGSSTRTILRRPGIRSGVLKLTGLFALDAFAGGLAVQTMLAVWFSPRGAQRGVSKRAA